MAMARLFEHSGFERDPIEMASGFVKCLAPHHVSSTWYGNLLRALTKS